MTRMAPMHRTSGPLATARSAAVEFRAGTRVVSARWRLGLRGTLTLEVHDAGRDGVARATASIVRSRDTGARVVELRAQLDPSVDVSMDASMDASECGAAEVRWTLTSISDGSPISARAALVRVAGPDSAQLPLLLVTDLPEALGLQGGTYVLESLDVTPDAI